MLKAVLFDLDGTLLDTVPDIQKCVNDMLVSRGYPTIDYAQTCAYVGDGAIKLIVRALPAGAGDVEECYRQFRTAYATSSNALTRLFPDELEMLLAGKSTEQIVRHMNNEIKKRKKKEEEAKAEFDLIKKVKESEIKVKTAEVFLKNGIISKEDYEKIVAEKEENVKKLQELKDKKAKKEELKCAEVQEVKGEEKPETDEKPAEEEKETKEIKEENSVSAKKPRKPRAKKQDENKEDKGE